jgi:uncharacterized membrane protein YgcG
MSSSDFSKVKVLYDVLNTTDSVRYAVVAGAQNITPSKYNAISKSTSSITFNIQTPSESTLLARRIMIRNVMEITIVAKFVQGTTPNGTLAVNYGFSESLAPFPFQTALNTCQLTINNNTISQNEKDVLFQLLRFNDRRDLARYNNACPTMYDSYYAYQDALGANNNPLGAWNDVAHDQDFQPRGTFRVLDISGNDPYLTSAPTLVDRTIKIKFETIEPFMLSPLIWCDPKSNNQGFYGIQVLNCVFNLASDTSRILRSAQSAFLASDYGAGGAPGTTPNPAFADLKCSLTDIAESQLFIQYYTRQPSDLVSARNCVPFAEYPRYLSPIGELIKAATKDATTGIITPSKYTSINSQSISLNSIPDKLIICVRKQISKQTLYDSDHFLPISKIVVNFNNKAGLLSSATQWDLWRMSVESGSNSTWSEFKGVAAVGGALGKYPEGYNEIPLVGSVLCLEMGNHIELDDVFSAGSIGQFQLQFQLDIENYSNEAFQPNDLEICLITMNSGVFVLERGTSQTYTAILSRSDVLSAKSQPGMSHSDVKRLVGGGWDDIMKTIKNVAGVVGQVAPMAQQALGAFGYGSSGAGTSGGGTSGGGTSGGGMSGGRVKKHLTCM